MAEKLGSYISKLMTTILDKEQEEFVKNLALGELKRLNANIGEFLSTSLKDEMESDSQEKPCCVKRKEKQLLQEEIQDGK